MIGLAARDRASQTRDVRHARGKALRHSMPRSANAAWEPPESRRDPVTILQEQGYLRITDLLPIRYGRMQVSPLAFFRGAAAVMAADLAQTAQAGITVQSCGDCHLNNFGTYATPEGIPVFDINDFDETSPGPFEWDIKRLATSLVLAARQAGFQETHARKLAVSATRAYVDEITRLAALPAIKAWNVRIDLHHVISAIGNIRVRDRLSSRLERQADAVTRQFGIVEPGYLPKLHDNPPFIQRLPSQHQTVRDAFSRYIEQLSPERRLLLDRFSLKDVVFKVVGVGSVGTFCAIGLYATADGEPLLLQIKEAQQSVLEPYTGVSIYGNAGARVVNGQRIMQAASDGFLGWTKTTGSRTTNQTGKRAGAGREFYVRQAKDSRLASLGERIEDELLTDYATLCGRTLGRAHARSADTAFLAGYLGKGRSFCEAIGDFAVRYADQTENDWHVFTKAIQAGILKANDA